LFTLLSGLRRRNVAAIRWDHVNFDQKALFIPISKSGNPFTLPLSDKMIEVLNDRKAYHDVNIKSGNKSYGWVFPSKTSKSGHIEEPKQKSG